MDGPDSYSKTKELIKTKKYLRIMLVKTRINKIVTDASKRINKIKNQK